MITIISHGQPNVEKPFEGKCYYCNSQIQADKSDLRNLDYCPREAKQLGKIDCPVCDKEMTVWR